MKIVTAHRALEHYTGEITPVEVNYEKNRLHKPHSCLMEKVEKK